ncbi:hypothetical protein RhiirA4_514414 [Rhizophagus irregularis]|uniref:Uncharacterized protein n=1 Tax=Rhizophagus irregularis TaxID=588596 RepID=A0A2I1HJW1_9GLOM|nr:hypothetical protein RhiirA4_514414 [Rhizophagus irregularis]
MGKNNKKNNKKKSSYIPTQEFVDKFTEALIHTTRKILLGLEYHPKDFTAKVLKPEVPGGDLVKPRSHAEKELQYGPLTSEVFHGHWKLKDRKERERFQAKIHIPTDASEHDFNNYYKGQPFGNFVLKKLKAKSFTHIMDKGQRIVIVYFESQKELHNAMELQQAWKMTESHSPHNKRKQSDILFFFLNFREFPFFRLGFPRSSSNNSRDKSKKHTKKNDNDTRSLLKLILNLLS